ncbi:hypothetical protein MMC26_002533 [Xylographa opegraphella]|nr:hypothetical protein [Xylographa opegraphella]
MSFFGFDSSLPKDRGHPSAAPGFGQAPDPFVGLSQDRARYDDDDDAIDFEDTYDGLADQLVETNDDFNDDTFGGGEISGGKTSKPVGKDFDFFGQTAKVSDAINEEQMRFSRQQAPPTSASSFAISQPKQAAKPIRSGYEKNQEPTRNLQVDPNLWGAAAQPSPGLHYGNGQPSSYGQTGLQQAAYTAGSARKMMSLEEVEAQMRSQTKKAPPAQALQYQGLPQPASPIINNKETSRSALEPPNYQRQQPSQQTVDSRQATVPFQKGPFRQTSIAQAELPASMARTPQLLQRPQSLSQNITDPNQAHPRQILQNPERHQAQTGPASTLQPQGQNHSRFLPSGSTGAHYSQQVITHPQQLMQLSEAERAAFLVEDAKRAKRNHKIYLLSKDNGLMTPQDKNFITRIQLQQLMTTTGNANDQDSDAALSEDFYYQVHSQIRGGPRQNPHQPLSQFAQTYLFQTGGRQGGFSRRNNRVGDNHMQRMEQQVARAVEAAKLKPKNKQLVIEGSLGKISFSNAKTPKPLLNLKRNDSGDVSNRPQGPGRNSSTRKFTQTEMSASDRKSVLRNIEAVYSTLMKMEDAMRREPPLPIPETEDVTAAERHEQWLKEKSKLNESLWNDLKVMNPINSGSSIPHPFIAFLSYAKGKKAIPRVFRHLVDQQRVTMMTIIIFHLDILEVVRLGQLQPGETQLPPMAREAIDLFSAAVTPSLFSYVSDASLFYISGLLGLMLDRVNVQGVARTRVGLSILTMLTSRATLIRDAGEFKDAEWQNWSQLFNRLFDILEPSLDGIFPGSLNTGEDIYVWQFLAAIGSGASPEQQQRLVLAVKDRVMETVMQSKTLPPEMASQRLNNVNLFMRAIGLDVGLLG